jgi:hypothetical protein
MPLYGQIVVSREGANDVPVPKTGTEAAVANSEAILVATRGDREGDVLIEVRRDVRETAGREVYRGTLEVPSGRLVVGNLLANQVEVIDVRRSGRVDVTIYVDRAEGASKVVVVVK